MICQWQTRTRDAWISCRVNAVERITCGPHVKVYCAAHADRVADLLPKNSFTRESLG